MPLDNFSKVDFSKIDPSEYEEEPGEGGGLSDEGGVGVVGGEGRLQAADARGAGPLRAGEPTCAAFGAAPGMVMSAIDLDDDRGQRPCSSGHAAGKRKATARVYPRRKAGELVRSTNKAIVVTREMLEPYFGTPLRNAAVHMGLCPTALKSVCRKLGIHRWPYQQSRRPPGAFGGDAVGTEHDGDEMSSSSSMSGAATVEAVSPTSNSPCEGPLEDNAATALQLDCAEAQALDSDSCDAVLDECAGSCENVAGVVPSESVPVPLSRLMQKPRSDDTHARVGVYAGSTQVLTAASCMATDDTYNPHTRPDMFAYMGGAYPYFAQRLPSQRSSVAEVPYGHVAPMPAPRGHTGTGEAPAADTLSRRRASTGARKKASRPRGIDSGDKGAKWSELPEGVEAEVELSRAAHKLELEEWSFLAQYMAAHQVKRERFVNDGWAYDESSVCDMAWLSPCS